jgi:CIC family chloride channel protein
LVFDSRQEAETPVIVNTSNASDSSKDTFSTSQALAPEYRGDFTIAPRTLWIAALAVPIGAASAVFAFILLRLISFFTNVFYYGRFTTAGVSPAGHHLGWLAVFVPIFGMMIVGVMARYGSHRIRGHGIPEAIESILLNGSKIEPKVAILKPIATAISIGCGGPFGAEGPIIMTGGAFGSMVAQMFHLTSAERKTLLVAGAAGGMSATFAAPVSSVLLAIELLLFERKPRSIIPVAMASATAALLRRYLLGEGPIFPAVPHSAGFSPLVLIGCVLAGLIGGLVSVPLSRSIYASEELFERLPIHWMWWPAIGGLFVGIGGLFFPQALGVGYDVIGQLVQGNHALHLVLGVLLVKWAIWSVSLGSGTSGGVLAPLMMIGAALGGLESYVFPDGGAGFWALIGIGAVLSGAMRVPMTAIVFTVEQTHDWNMLLPLLIGCVASYSVSVLILRRSILTEKVARRGYHLSCEYAMDPLELLHVREVMRTNIVVLSATGTLRETAQALRTDHRRSQRLLPVVDGHGRLAGVLTRSDIRKRVEEGGGAALAQPLAAIVRANPVAAYPDEPLRSVVYRMAEKGVTRLPVIERGAEEKLLGLVSLDDLLKARTRSLEDERRRERILRLQFLFPRKRARSDTPATP